MTIQEFIKQTLDAYDLKHDPAAVLEQIKNKARSQAKNGVAAIDDDTVKDWILSFDPNAKKAIAPTVKTIKEYDEKIKEKYEKKPETKPQPPKEEKKEEKQNEQLSLFDLL